MSANIGVAAEVKAKGFAFVSAHMPGAESREAIACLGAIEVLDGINEIQELTPKDSSNAPPNIYSGNFGLGVFPFHTDLAHWFVPPRYLILRCAQGSPGVKTRLLDSSDIVRTIGELRLARTLVQPRRPIGSERGLLRILEQSFASSPCFRWDSLFIVPSSASSARTFKDVGDFLPYAGTVDFELEHSGDTLVVDNWRMLHARSAVSYEQTNRRIHRAYVSDLK